MLGVFTQVDGRHDAEGNDGEAHQESHDESAEDRRKDAAFGIGLARIEREEIPDVVKKQADLLVENESVWQGESDKFAHGETALDAVRGGVNEGSGGLDGAEFAGLGGEELIIGVEGGDFFQGFRGSLAFGSELGDAGIDGADVVFFDLFDLLAAGGGFSIQAGEGLGESRGIRWQGGAIRELERFWVGEGDAIFHALEAVDAPRFGDGGDVGVVKEGETGAVDILVAHEDLDFGLIFDFVAGGAEDRNAFLAGLDDFAGECVPGIGEGIFDSRLEVDFDNFRGPENRQAVGHDHAKQADDHDQAQSEAHGGEPDEGFAGGGEGSGEFEVLGISVAHGLGRLKFFPEVLAENLGDGVDGKSE